MTKLFAQPNFNAIVLSRKLAMRHLEDLTALANQIPQVTYRPEDIAEPEAQILPIENLYHFI